MFAARFSARFSGRLAARREAGASKRSNELGMTLIEIMVVVMIIGLIMGTVAIVAYNQFKKAQRKNTDTVIKNVESGVEMYMMDNNGECPKTLTELYTQKILNKEPKDAWGQQLMFRCPGEHNTDGIDVWSKGPDRREGTEDDVGNWE